MRSYWLAFFSGLSLLLFSFCLCLSKNLSFLWIFLELCTLSLVPAFILFQKRGLLSSLFNYLVVSSVASSMIICSVLLESFNFLLVIGFFIKFGVFPFLGWVYSVLLGSNNFVVWAFSTLLKVPFFVFPFFLSVGFLTWNWFDIFYLTSFLFLSLFFWLYSYGLLHCWVHMMLSSSVVLLICSLSLSTLSLVYFYIVYFVWASAVVYYLDWFSSGGFIGVGSVLFFVFLFLAFPLSFSLFYKVLSGFFMYSCGVAIFFSWVVYSISEQAYMFFLLLGTSLPRLEWDSFSVL